MLKKISDFLGGTLMTAVGGVFLVISLVLMLTDTYFPVDPAWVSVIICGIPLAYQDQFRTADHHCHGGGAGYR